MKLNLSNHINITDEMRNTYNTVKRSIIEKKISMALCIIGLLGIVLFAIHFVFTLIGFVLLFVGIYLFWKSTKYGSIQKNYINKCLYPLISQIIPNVEIKNEFDYFPLYGYVKNTNVSTDICKLTHNKDLGMFLKNRCVIPEFYSNFKYDIVVDALNSENGFLFSNAIATTITYDAKGDKKTRVEFEGPLVVLKTTKEVRSGVGIYTSKISTMLKKEKKNGYVKISTINTENEEFNKNFEVTAEEDSQAFFVLSPLVMEKLISIKEKYGRFGVYLNKNYIIFGINIRKMLLSMPKSILDVKKMSIENTTQEMLELLSIVNDFKEAIDFF